MTTDPSLAFDIFLRLVGAFYALASVATIRIGAMNALLGRALGAIATVGRREAAAERNRTLMLIGNSVLYGIGGILLAATLDLAAALFVISAVFYGLYLFLLCPLVLDPWDPPEEPGRTQTRNAFWIYLAATAVVVYAWSNDGLRPIMSERPAVLVIVAVLSVGLAGFAVRQLRLALSISPLVRHKAAGPPEDRQVRSVVLTPSWNDGGLLDAETGEPVYWLPEAELPPQNSKRLRNWLKLFSELADPHDPLRARLIDPGSRDRLESAGRPIYEDMLSRMGPDRVRFEPDPRPCPPQVEVAAIAVVAERGGDPLRRLESGEEAYLSPDHIGISWQLAQDLLDWSFRFDSAFDPDDCDRPPAWSEDVAFGHGQEGKRLAERLAAELVATDRGQVTVVYRPYRAEEEAIRPG